MSRFTLFTFVFASLVGFGSLKAEENWAEKILGFKEKPVEADKVLYEVSKLKKGTQDESILNAIETLLQSPKVFDSEAAIFTYARVDGDLTHSRFKRFLARTRKLIADPSTPADQRKKSVCVLGNYLFRAWWTSYFEKSEDENLLTGKEKVKSENLMANLWTDPDEEIRMLAADFSGHRGSENFAKQIAQVLYDENAEVMNKKIEALGEVLSFHWLNPSNIFDRPISIHIGSRALPHLKQLLVLAVQPETKVDTKGLASILGSAGLSVQSLIPQMRDFMEVSGNRSGIFDRDNTVRMVEVLAENDDAETKKLFLGAFEEVVDAVKRRDRLEVHHLESAMGIIARFKGVDIVKAFDPVFEMETTEDMYWNPSALALQFLRVKNSESELYREKFLNAMSVHAETFFAKELNARRQSFRFFYQMANYQESQPWVERIQSQLLAYPAKEALALLAADVRTEEVKKSPYSKYTPFGKIFQGEKVNQDKAFELWVKLSTKLIEEAGPAQSALSDVTELRKAMDYYAENREVQIDFVFLKQNVIPAMASSDATISKLASSYLTTARTAIPYHKMKITGWGDEGSVAIKSLNAAMLEASKSDGAAFALCERIFTEKLAYDAQEEFIKSLTDEKLIEHFKKLI